MYGTILIMSVSNTTVPHVLDVVRVMNRCKMGHRLVSEKILGDCVTIILSAAKRGETHAVFVIPYMKTGYPAYKLDDVRYWILYQLLQKKFIAVPFKTNKLYVQWSTMSNKTSVK